METLQNLDGTMTTEPTEIHQILTAWFSKWFEYDRDTTNTLHAADNWINLLHDKTQFTAMLENTSMTSDIKEILWESMHQTATRLTADDRQEL